MLNTHVHHRNRTVEKENVERKKCQLKKPLTREMTHHSTTLWISCFQKMVADGRHTSQTGKEMRVALLIQQLLL